MPEQLLPKYMGGLHGFQAFSIFSGFNKFFNNFRALDRFWCAKFDSSYCDVWYRLRGLYFVGECLRCSLACPKVESSIFAGSSIASPQIVSILYQNFDFARCSKNESNTGIVPKVRSALNVRTYIVCLLTIPPRLEKIPTLFFPKF